MFVGQQLYADTVNVNVEVSVETCSDGIDNDGDGKTDFPDDPGCEDVLDKNEVDPVFACSDGIDNDGDGKTDFPDDPGCDNSTDTSEVDIVQNNGSSSSSSSDTAYAVLFNGLAYQNSIVDVLIDGVKVATVTTNSGGNFTYMYEYKETRQYNITFLSRDKTGVSSLAFTLPMGRSVSQDAVVSTVFIPPTLVFAEEDANEFLLSGFTAPFAEVTLRDVARSVTFSASANKSGYYSVLVPNNEATYQAKAAINNRISIWSKQLFVSEELVSGESGKPADLNNDGLVNLVDYSIAVFWYEKRLEGSIIRKEVDHLNADGKIDLRDLSLLAYYWTG